MRICIYGAGAMGTSLGALFLGQRIPCELVTRNAEQVSALKKGGYTAFLPEEMTGAYDLILLSAKQRDNRSIAEFLLSFLKADGALVSVQNGLPEQALAEVLGADRVYGCTLSWGAETVAPGVVRVTSESGYRFALGAYGKGERLSEIAELMKRLGEVTVGNLTELRYAKLAVNAAFSTLSAISGLTFGEIAKKHKKYALGILKEVFAAARTEGCESLPLNGHNLFRVFGGFWAGAALPLAMKKYARTRSGMLADIRAGRRCDVDFVAGAAVRAGKLLGVEMPILTRAVALVHEIENGFAEIAPESLEFLSERSEICG